MKRVRKEWIISDLVERLERSKLVLVSHVGHMPGGKIEALRSQLNAAGGGLKLVKSSLGRTAAERLSIPSVSAMFRGPSAVLHSGEVGDVETARIAVAFAKANPEFLILGGKLDGQELLHTHVHKLVSLKPERVYAELLGLIHPASTAGPIISLVDPSTHLRIPPISQLLALTLDAHVRQQQAASDGAPPP
jgi:large subunit ribosomal protein L10